MDILFGIALGLRVFGIAVPSWVLWFLGALALLSYLSIFVRLVFAAIPTMEDRLAELQQAFDKIEMHMRNEVISREYIAQLQWYLQVFPNIETAERLEAINRSEGYIADAIVGRIQGERWRDKVAAKMRRRMPDIDKRIANHQRELLIQIEELTKAQHANNAETRACYEAYL